MGRMSLEKLFWLHDRLVLRVVRNSYEFYNKRSSLPRPVAIATGSLMLVDAVGGVLLAVRGLWCHHPPLHLFSLSLTQPHMDTYTF